MDHRDYGCPSWMREDWASMEIILYPDDEERRIPALEETCPDCDGKGSYVNPDIDRHGLSADDFTEDPEFAEGYFRGVYNITCRLCGGKGKVLGPDEYRWSQEDRKAWEDAWEYEAQSRAEQDAERRMGY